VNKKQLNCLTILEIQQYGIAICLASDEKHMLLKKLEGEAKGEKPACRRGEVYRGPLLITTYSQET
jgi:hypothetical protein